MKAKDFLKKRAIYSTGTTNALANILKLGERLNTKLNLVHIDDVVVYGDLRVKEALNIEEAPVQSEPEEILIGFLTKPFGLKGFETAQIGHPVFETKDNYKIYLQNEKTSQEVTFYKKTLKPFINFKQ